MTSTIPLTQSLVRSVVDRLAIMRDVWATRSLESQANPSSRKAKGEMNEAHLRFAGATVLAADVLNEITGKNYTPFGIEMRLGDLAASVGLKPLSPYSTTAERHAHATQRDAMVDAFTSEILGD